MTRVARFLFGVPLFATALAVRAERASFDDRRGAAIDPASSVPTANRMEGDRQASLAAGMDGDGTKPIRVDILVDAMTKVAQREEHPS